jgi:hypothetical protein
MSKDAFQGTGCRLWPKAITFRIVSSGSEGKFSFIEEEEMDARLEAMFKA